MYWTQKEPIQEQRIKRREFIQSGLDEIDYDIKIRLRVPKPIIGKGWKLSLIHI